MELELRAIRLDPFNIAEHTADPKLIELFQTNAAPVRILNFLNVRKFNLEQSP